MVQVTKALGTYLRGWKEYFQLAATPGIFATLDGWIHRRLRALQLKQWRRGRCWWGAARHGALHTALPGAYFERLGVPRLAVLTSTC